MPARLSPTQLAALKAAADGKLSRQSSPPYRWNAASSSTTPAFIPRKATCDALFERGLISLDFDRADARWIPAPITDAGRAVLAETTTTPEGAS